MEGESAAINVGRQLTVGDTRPDCHRFGFRIEFDLVEMLKRNLFNSTIGDAIERVTRRKRFKMRLLTDTMPDVIDGICEVEVFGTVRVITGPIRKSHGSFHQTNARRIRSKTTPERERAR